MIHLVTVSECNRPTRTVWILHEVLGSEEDPHEVCEPVGALVHDAGVSVHVDLHPVALAQLHHHALPHHAVLVVGVVVLVVETGHLFHNTLVLHIPSYKKDLLMYVLN